MLSSKLHIKSDIYIRMRRYAVANLSYLFPYGLLYLVPPFWDLIHDVLYSVGVLMNVCFCIS